jgi:hypothetical protein
MLKDALAGLPTRPVLYLSVVVLGLGLGYHFLSTYVSCNSHAELRRSLRAAIEAGAESRLSVALSRITDFAWDTAEILVNYKPEGASTDCPFQWDWSRNAREALIADDRLTVIVFLRDGKLVNYLEYRRDQADFVAVENPYTPQTAIFQVEPSPNEADAYILTPASRSGLAR